MKSLGISIIFMLFVQEQICGQTIIWDSERPLTFADFRRTEISSPEIAAVSCKIDIKICKQSIWTGKITLSVTAIFYQDSSWYRPENVHSLTLQHEQGHFDIAEWYARKLRKIIETKIKNTTDYERDFQSIYRNVYREYFLTQDSYERQTEHGTIAAKQKEWEMKIQQELESLESYQDKPCK